MIIRNSQIFMLENLLCGVGTGSSSMKTSYR